MIPLARTRVRELDLRDLDLLAALQTRHAFERHPGTDTLPGLLHLEEARELVHFQEIGELADLLHARWLLSPAGERETTGLEVSRSVHLAATAAVLAPPAPERSVFTLLQEIRAEEASIPGLREVVVTLLHDAATPLDEILTTARAALTCCD